MIKLEKIKGKKRIKIISDGYSDYYKAYIHGAEKFIVSIDNNHHNRLYLRDYYQFGWESFRAIKRDLEGIHVIKKLDHVW